MRMVTKCLAKWPKLAWAARLDAEAGTVEVFHGPRVETAGDWCIEGVWAGEFREGDFDRTDLVFGTGLRLRGDRVSFVSAGTNLERLWSCRGERARYVSNSLAALLALSGFELDEGHDYGPDFRATKGDRPGYTSPVHARPAPLNVTYYANLVFDGREIREADKPDTTGALESFERYRTFLFDTASRLAANMNDPARRHGIVPAVAVSSGYDSPAAAVVARRAGCRLALTFRRANSLWGRADSGRAIAARLGMACRSYRRTADEFPDELAFWAGGGRPGILNWTLFEYPEPVCLLFSGHRGDVVWNRPDLAAAQPLRRWGLERSSMDEFRLHRGVFDCPVPYWGVRHVESIQRIALSSDMAPWRLGGKYDRPIPRRLVEEEGVPRGAFAARKKDTSHHAPFAWPWSTACRRQFAAYLRRRGLAAPSPAALRLIRRLAHVENLVYKNITGPLGLAWRLQPWKHLTSPSLLFLWANHEMKALYLDGLCP